MGLFLLQCLGISGLLLLAIAFGRWIGLRVRNRNSKEEKLTLSSSVGAILLLMSFMLVITYSMVSTRFAERKQLLLDDVNAIGTVFLRTDFLSPANRDESRSLIREYVDLRAYTREKAPDLKSLRVLANRWETIQKRLWNLAIRDQQLFSDPTGRKLYIESLNKMIDVHTTRYNIAIQLRLPNAVWILLATVTGLSMVTLGIEFGLSGIYSRAGVFVVILLTIMLSTLLLFLHEVDRPESNVVTINQQPMIDLYDSFAPDHNP